MSRHDVYPYSGKFAESDRPRFEQFCSVMEQLKEVPVRVHCIASYRVSAFFYRYSSRCARHGRCPSAGAEMETIWHPEGIWAAFVTAKREARP